jgi:hypothetical protein
MIAKVRNPDVSDMLWKRGKTNFYSKLLTNIVLKFYNYAQSGNIITIPERLILKAVSVSFVTVVQLSLNLMCKSRSNANLQFFPSSVKYEITLHCALSV